MPRLIAAAALAASIALAAMGGISLTGAAEQCAPGATVSYTAGSSSRTGTIWTVVNGQALVQRAGSATTQDAVACSALKFPSAPPAPTGPSGPTGSTGASGPTGPSSEPLQTIGAVGTITRLSTPGATYDRKRFLGQVIVTADNVTISNSTRNGATGNVGNTQSGSGGEDVGLWIQNADNVTITGSELKRDAWRAAIYISGSTGFYISRNDISDNGGTQPAEGNLQHGIYVSSGSGRIVNNRISGNRSFGVQLYPGATDVTVDGNVIARNGKAGVILGSKAARNTIASNWFDGNGTAAVEGCCGLTVPSDPTLPANRADGNWATGTGAAYIGDGYRKGSLILAAPPSSWTVPPVLALAAP